MYSRKRYGNFKAVRTEKQELLRLYLWSFLVRFAVGTLGWFLTTEFALPFLQDALYYEYLGAQVANDWLAGHSSVWLDAVIKNPNTLEAWGMIVFIAAFYWIMGGIRAVPVLIAVYGLTTAFIPVLVYRIACQLGAAPRNARISAWLVAVSPAFAFWSGALYKEGLVLLLMLLAVYNVLLLQERVRPVSLLVLALSLGALFSLRSYLAVMTIGVAVAGLVLGRRTAVKPGAVAGTILRQVLIVVLFIGAMGLFGFTDTLQRVVPTDLSTVLRQIQLSRSDLATAGSGYLQDADISTLDKSLSFLPVGLFYFLTVPWPWDLGTLRQTLIIPETAFWILLYPLLLIGMVRGLRRNFQGSVLLVGLSITISIFYALLIGNVGTAYRLRVQVWVLWAVFAGWGWEWWQEWWQKKRNMRRIRSRPVQPRPNGPDVMQV